MPPLYWVGVACTIASLVGSFIEFCTSVSEERGGSAVISALFIAGNSYTVWYLLTGGSR